MRFVKIILPLLIGIPFFLFASSKHANIKIDGNEMRITHSLDSLSRDLQIILPANVHLRGRVSIRMDKEMRPLEGMVDEIFQSSEIRMGLFEMRSYSYRSASPFSRFEISGEIEESAQSQRILRNFIPLVEALTGTELPSNVEIVDGTYVIILPDVDTYLSLAQSLAGWKRQLGYPTVIKQLGELGNSSTDIYSFLQDAYQNWEIPPEFVLLIGDVDGSSAMPSNYFSAENDVSDHPYACVDGEDYFPDLFVGRLSVDSFTHLAIAVQKIVGYEKNPFMESTDWFTHAVSIGGNYNNVGNYPITPVWVAKWVREFLLEHGFTSVDTLFYPPNVNAGDEITGFINAGASFVNYRGWADANGWHFPEYHVNDLENLQNGWMLPVVTSIVCNTGDFANTVDPCFGEAWLRAGTIQNPEGAVAFYGPSDLHTSTKFNNAICTGIYEGIFNENITRIGPAGARGKIELYNGFPQNRTAGDWVEFYFHVYNLLGDPALQIWRNAPRSLDCTVPETLFREQSTLTVHVESDGIAVRNALVTLIDHENILARGRTNTAGDCLLIFPPLNDDVVLTISKPDFVPEEFSYSPVQAEGLSTKNIEFSGLNENGARKGDQIEVNCELFNYSSADISNYSLNFTSTSGNIVQESEDIVVPYISAGDSVQISGIVLNVNELSPFTSNEEILLNGGECGGFELPVYSLYLNRGRIFINGKETLIASSSEEEVNLQVELKNLGALATGSLTASLSSVNDMVQIITDESEYGNIYPSETGLNNPSFRIRFSDLSPGSQVPFILSITDGYGVNEQISFTLIVGPVSKEMATGPDNYGYFIYDNYDEFNGQLLSCEWIDIGGLPHQQEIQLFDDEITGIDLPFSFVYYGNVYTSVTLCSNGWISFEPASFPWFRNWSMAAAITADGSIAGFWDDLKPPVDEDKMTVRMGWDEDVVIFEWIDALNRYDYDSGNPYPEKFQIQLWRPGVLPSDTEDGVIDILFQEVHDVDAVNNFSTIGLKSPDGESSLDYLYSRISSGGAVSTDSLQCVRISTLTPEGVIVSNRDVKTPLVFSLSEPYPNPFNSRVYIEYSFDPSDRITWVIYSLEGKFIDGGEISTPGNRGTWIWDGKNRRGYDIPSGLYLVNFRGISGKTISVKKILYLK